MPRTEESPDPAVTPLTVLALGVAIELRVHGEQLAQEVALLWARSVTEGADAPAAVLVVGDDPDEPVEQVLHDLSWRVTRAAIDANAGRLLMLHGCGVADVRTGATAVLVAPSGTGKTTAALALCLSTGRGYVTDETVGIARDGTVYPHPKPLSIVQAGSDLKRQVGADEVPLAAPPASLHLAAVVLLQRDGTTPASVEQLRPAVAIPLLAEEMSYFGRLPRPLSFTHDVLRGSQGTFAVRYADAGDLAPVLDRVLASS